MQPLSDANFKKGFNRIYDWNLARSLNRIYSKVGLTFVWSQFVEIWSHPAFLVGRAHSCTQPLGRFGISLTITCCAPG